MCEREEEIVPLREETMMEYLNRFRKGMTDEERWDSIYRLKHNFSEAYDNRVGINPEGMTNFDVSAIPPDKRAGLEKFKNKVRKENYMYLEKHPEIEAIISLFLAKLLHAQPFDTVLFAAEFFTGKHTTMAEFQNNIKNEVRRLKHNRNKSYSEVRTRLGLDESKDEKDILDLKKLHLEGLAVDIEEPKPVECIKKKPKESVVEKVKKPYCGCKDHKRKKKSTAEPQTEDKEEEFEILPEEQFAHVTTLSSASSQSGKSRSGMDTLQSLPCIPSECFKILCENYLAAGCGACGEELLDCTSEPEANVTEHEEVTTTTPPPENTEGYLAHVTKKKKKKKKKKQHGMEW